MKCQRVTKGLPMMKVLAIAVLIVSFYLSSLAHAVGLGFDKTRLIIQGDRNTGSVVFDNRTDGAFFVRTHLEDLNKKKTNKGMARPPVFQVNPQRAARIQVVIDDKQLPKDRESMFWLYTKAYPAQKVDDKAQSKMMFNYAFQMKVFYRPSSIQGTYIDAAKSLIWYAENGQLHVRNDSAFNISLVGVEINQKHVDTNKVISPFSSENLGHKVNPNFLKNKFLWYVIADDGSAMRFPNAN